MAQPKLDDIRARLAAVGQEHLLRFAGTLDAAALTSLLAQIAALPLAQVPDLIERYVRRSPEFPIPARLGPAPYFPADSASPRRPWDHLEAKARGEELLGAGKVGCFTVAGGQGTRLGFEGPKGCFPAGAVTGKPLFAIFAEGVQAAERRSKRTVPWYIMTSPLNHEATLAFFKTNHYFGLDPKQVMMFPQGVMPSFEMGTGRLLLASPGEVATNPDGHGGSITALATSGALEDMSKRGVEHISYFQVDNPLVRVIDPVFIGLHASGAGTSAEMSSKMIAKTGPGEKVGVFCIADGRVMVIEYSDLPKNLAEERWEDGALKFIAGSPAIHMIGVRFATKLASDPAFGLPFHRAEKKVPFVDEQGRLVEPEKPNAVKLERFVFDALPLCRGSIVLETRREDEFGPIKNATGVDSVESCKAMQTARAARWLEAAGVRVPRRADGAPDCVLEISPLTATCAEDLGQASLPKRIEAGAKLAL